MRTKFSNKIEKFQSPAEGFVTEGYDVEEKYTPEQELGVAGVKISSGFVHDEFITKLIGESGRRTYRQMRDNDSTIGSIIFAIEMLIRAVEWNVEYDVDRLDEETAAGLELDKIKEGTEPIIPGVVNNIESAILFVEGVLFDDMDTTWDDFITIVLSMLTFGWQYTEVVYKRRLGPDNPDEEKRSNYDDGLIGIRKLADRSQETLDRWNIDKNGKIMGLWQNPPVGGTVRYIPYEKALHFTPHPNKDNPEGRSVLRNAYRPWYFLKNIQEIEAIAIERELNGLPVISIPNAILNGEGEEAVRAKNAYVKMARDIKFNEQGGVVIPSDPYYDDEGKPTNIRKVELKLLSSEGTRAIDVDKSIVRYQTDIARTVLAEFIMLGSTSSGTRSLGETKVELFLQAIQGWTDSIAATINRHLLPTLWKLNGFDRNIMPELVPGKVTPDKLSELGDFVKALASAGIFLADEETENTLRKIAGLPPKSLEDEGVDLNENNTGDVE